MVSVDWSGLAGACERAVLGDEREVPVLNAGLGGAGAVLQLTGDRVLGQAEDVDGGAPFGGPESHAINDLGIDSLDFLDIAFAIDKAFGIKLPLERWTQEVNDGKATTEQYFVLKNLSARIDELVAAKA